MSSPASRIWHGQHLTMSSCGGVIFHYPPEKQVHIHLPAHRSWDPRHLSIGVHMPAPRLGQMAGQSDGHAVTGLDSWSERQTVPTGSFLSVCTALSHYQQFPAHYIKCDASFILQNTLSAHTHMVLLWTLSRQHQQPPGTTKNSAYYHGLWLHTISWWWRMRVFDDRGCHLSEETGKW